MMRRGERDGGGLALAAGGGVGVGLGQAQDLLVLLVGGGDLGVALGQHRTQDLEVGQRLGEVNRRATSIRSTNI